MLGAIDPALLIWGKLIISCSLTYFVYRDTIKNDVPYRNAWIVFTFVFFPVIVIYFYYKYHLGKKRSRSNLYHREMEMREKIAEQQRKLREDIREFERAKREEAAKNQDAEEEIKAAIKARNDEKEKRFAELKAERDLQEEAAAKALHLK